VASNSGPGSTVDLLRAYLEAVVLSEPLQTRIWATAELTLTQLRVLRHLRVQAFLGSTMAQCLHLMNAPEVERKTASATGRVARLLKDKAGEDKIGEELCLAALGRLPGDKEKRAAKKLFAQGPPEQAAQDFLWALLNSYEFLFVQ